MTTTGVETYRFDEVGAQFTVIVGLDAEKTLYAFIGRFVRHEEAA